MRIVRFNKVQVIPTFLTDDFGTAVQVIPGEFCRLSDSLAEQRVVDAASWQALVDAPLREFE